jgi:CheY-like chemotaxis protein
MKRTILLADDSPTIRRLVTQTFAGANYTIVEVSNGEAAIKRLEELRPSIVLADIYMPGKNGYEVCTYIRNHETLHDTPVVLLVGAFDAFDEEVAKQSGATANITKPFEPGALIELVNSLLPPDEAEPEPQIHLEHEVGAKAVGEVKSETNFEARSFPPPVNEKPTPPHPEPAPAAAAPLPAAPPTPAAAAGSVAAPESTAETEDLLGLETIFKQEPEEVVSVITDEDVDRIADRVIQRLSSAVIESIAWDIVPDITEKIVREELKRIDEG